ncbi:hypothetical protein IH992_15150 [Candidatus Poribacteria bacterium]|nr:hypothetical protein [Candidatus Poribacteria bacterium]
MLSYDSFTLERAIFELRFHAGYLYWDNCGKIWCILSEKWPNLSMGKVDTSQANFQLDDNDIHLSFSYNRFGVHQDYPKKRDFFPRFTDESSQVILEYLQINTFTRIGNRYQYMSGVDDIDEVTKLLVDRGLFNISSKMENLGKKISEPNIKFLIEKNDISITVRIGYVKRELEFSVPKPLKVDESAFIKQGISVDLDFFTTKPVDRGILNVADLITTHQRSSRLQPIKEVPET